MTSSPTTTHCSCGCRACAAPRADARGPETWLTPEQVVEYVRGAVTLGTLRNYRSARGGPRFLNCALTIRSAVDDAALVEYLPALAVYADQAGDAYDSGCSCARGLTPAAGTLKATARRGLFPAGMVPYESEEDEEL